MSHESQSIGNVRVTHYDPDAPWPTRKPQAVTNAMVINAVETRGSEILSYRRDTRRSPSCGTLASSSASRRSHRRSKSR